MSNPRDVAKRAIADGFSNGNEQYDDASPAQQARYDMAADAILSALQPAVTDEAVRAAARAISSLGPHGTPLHREKDIARAALTAALPFMMGDKANG